MKPSESTYVIVLTKFAKHEDLKIRLEAVLWDSDTIICVDSREETVHRTTPKRQGRWGRREGG
jgi:hypothetical protein